MTQLLVGGAVIALLYYNKEGFGVKDIPGLPAQAGDEGIDDKKAEKELAYIQRRIGDNKAEKEKELAYIQQLKGDEKYDEKRLQIAQDKMARGTKNVPKEYPLNEIGAPVA
jgi:hypothetical protein